MLSDIEEVARIIFSPRMIHNGVLLPEAFKLREVIGEEYLSVLRTSIDGWRDDALRIPQRPNRRLYGFAEMKVGDIRQAAFINVRFDVLDCATESMPSHAGIFICVGDEPIIGGHQLRKVPDGFSQDFLLLSIQRRLVEIARKHLHTMSEN